MHPHPRRRGATAVEMAIVLPLLLVLVFGIIEFGRAMMVQQILVNTAREATRRAVIPGATDEQVYKIIDGYLANAGIDEFDVKLELDDTPHDLEEEIENGESLYSDSIENAHSKTRVGIEVSVLHEDVAWGPLRMIASDRRISSNMILMRKE
ncbi:MAG: pilus assembly protein [Rubripirellula sp.]|nr:pilus assembly protein [Rubripirellula sp.]